MNEERPVVAKILETAENILRDKGDHGLSMRKVAAGSGISLGHLQHYFKTKDDILSALVRSYFERCANALKAHATSQPSNNVEERTANFVTFGLTFIGGDLSDMCRLFREFWALASRNEAISKSLDEYYEAYREALVEFLSPVADSPAAAERAVAFLIPWFEGHSITHYEMKSNNLSLELFLTRTVVAILTNEIKGM